MQDKRRVDLIFPRSGQVLPIYVPDSMVEWVAKRNLQILLSLYNFGTPSSQISLINEMHLYPS
jgi:hypothetical protein